MAVVASVVVPALVVVVALVVVAVVVLRVVVVVLVVAVVLVVVVVAALRADGAEHHLSVATLEVAGQLPPHSGEHLAPLRLAEVLSVSPDELCGFV